MALVHVGRDVIDTTTGQIVSGPDAHGSAAAGSSTGGAASGAVGANGLPLGQLRTSDGTQSFLIDANGRPVMVAPGEVQSMLQRGYQLPNADQQAWVQNEQASRNPAYYPVNGQTTAAGAATSTPVADTTTAAGHAQSAASVTNNLRQNGLEALIPLIDQWTIDNLSDAEIEAMLYDPTTEAGKVVDAIYPEIRMLRQAGKEPLSIPGIQALRSQYRNVFRAHDAPTGFYDQTSDFTGYIVAGKSPDEINSDLIAWRGVADEAASDPANATTLSELNRIYGITPDSGAFLAYVIDPAKGLDTIQRQITAGTLSATAARTGFGGLSQQEAEQLGARGVTRGQAAAAFGELAGDRQLTGGIVGVNGETLSREEQIAAGFDTDAAARAKLERVRGQRLGEFDAGGRPAAGRGSGGLRAV